jgi:hypothetical protein
VEGSVWKSAEDLASGLALRCFYLREMPISIIYQHFATAKRSGN